LYYSGKISITLFYHQNKIFDKTFMVYTKLNKALRHVTETAHSFYYLFLQFTITNILIQVYLDSCLAFNNEL